MSRSAQPISRGAMSASKAATRAGSQPLAAESTGKIPEASPIPTTCSPVSRQ